MKKNIFLILGVGLVLTFGFLTALSHTSSAPAGLQKEQLVQNP